MPLPKQVEAARVMVEAAEEAQRKSLEGGSKDQNPADKDSAPNPATEQKPVTQEEGVGVLDWEHEYKLLSEKHDKLNARFSVIQGKYNSEVPALHEEVKKLKARISGADSGGSESDDGDDDDDLASQKQLYGEDLVNFIVGQKSPAQDEISKLKEQVEKLEGSKQEDAANKFFGTLAAAHPDWKMINQTSAFIGFLSGVDPVRGLVRQAIIDAAQDSGDPQPIIDQLTAFKAHLQVASGKARQVVPKDGGGSGVPATKDGEIIPLSVISKFYKDAGIAAAKGRTVSDTEEYKRLDREYSKAASEGRVDASR